MKDNAVTPLGTMLLAGLVVGMLGTTAQAQHESRLTTRDSTSGLPLPGVGPGSAARTPA